MKLSGAAHPLGFSRLTVVVNVVVPEHDVDGASGLVADEQIRQTGAVRNELFPRLLALHSRTAPVGVKTHLGRDARSRDGVTSISVRGGDSGTIDGARQRGNECSSGPHGVSVRACSFPGLEDGAALGGDTAQSPRARSWVAVYIFGRGTAWAPPCFSASDTPRWDTTLPVTALSSGHFVGILCRAREVDSAPETPDGPHIGRSGPSRSRRQ